MTTFEMLQYGFILAWDDDTGIVVTWNGSATYNIWVGDGSEWDNVDVRTINPNPNGMPVSMDIAADTANEVLTNVIRGE